jgi:YD repeat-containing protein
LPFSANPSGWLWANGTAHQRLVDLAGRTQKVETLGVLSRTLTRDAVGNPVKITDAQNAARTQTLTYNFLDSLLTEKTSSGRNDRFGYDLNHNRASLMKDSTGTNGYSYGYTGSQLTSVMHNTTYATNSLAYDAAGNLIQDSTRSFNYDARGRMTSMTKNNQTTQYYYNGLGQRFSKNGVIYMYDLQGHLIGEYTNAGALIQETVWLNDLPIATIRPS